MKIIYEENWIDFEPENYMDKLYIYNFFKIGYKHEGSKNMEVRYTCYGNPEGKTFSDIFSKILDRNDEDLERELIDQINELRVYNTNI